MALLDAYATATEYRAMTGDKATGTDATLDAQLVAMSRMVEKSLQLMAGAFNTHSGTYVFDCHGGRLLWLRDRAGLAYFLQTITANALGIDLDRDGSYDYYTLDLADTWVRGLPENAAALSEPFTAIEILGDRVNAAPTEWPEMAAGVRIAGTWGWAAVPRIVKDLVIHRTHELREAHKGGALEAMSNFEGLGGAFNASGGAMGSRTFWLWKEAERLYGRRLPVIA